MMSAISHLTLDCPGNNDYSRIRALKDYKLGLSERCVVAADRWRKHQKVQRQQTNHIVCRRIGQSATNYDKERCQIHA